MSKAIVSLQLFLTERGYSPRTNEAYLFWARRLESHYPDRDLRALKPPDIVAFFSHLQSKRFKGESIRQATSAIRFLYREILRAPQLADAVPSVKEARPQAILPTQEQILKVIASVADPQAKLIFQCIYGLGLELQEARTLRVRNFDVPNKALRFAAQRTKITRTVPLPGQIVDALGEALAGKGPAEFVFLSRRGTPLSESAIQRAWTKARLEARVPAHATIRALRHCYISHLELLGLRLVDVLHHMGVRKDRALAYYAAYHPISAELPFSPLDRVVHDDSASLASAETPYV